MKTSSKESDFVVHIPLDLFAQTQTAVDEEHRTTDGLVRGATIYRLAMEVNSSLC